jgi:hypothetical protein
VDLFTFYLICADDLQILVLCSFFCFLVNLVNHACWQEAEEGEEKHKEKMGFRNRKIIGKTTGSSSETRLESNCEQRLASSDIWYESFEEKKFHRPL